MSELILKDITGVRYLYDLKSQTARKHNCVTCRSHNCWDSDECDCSNTYSVHRTVAPPPTQADSEDDFDRFIEKLLNGQIASMKLPEGTDELPNEEFPEETLRELFAMYISKQPASTARVSKPQYIDMICDGRIIRLENPDVVVSRNEQIRIAQEHNAKIIEDHYSKIHEQIPVAERQRQEELRQKSLKTNNDANVRLAAHFAAYKARRFREKYQLYMVECHFVGYSEFLTFEEFVQFTKDGCNISCAWMINLAHRKYGKQQHASCHWDDFTYATPQPQHGGPQRSESHYDAAQQFPGYTSNAFDNEQIHEGLRLLKVSYAKIQTIDITIVKKRFTELVMQYHPDKAHSLSEDEKIDANVIIVVVTKAKKYFDSVRV